MERRKGKLHRARSSPWVLPVIVIVLAIALCAGYMLFRDDRTTVKVSGAYALYPMMTIWAKEYEEENPNVRIDVSGGGAGKGMTDVLSGLVDIGMVSRDIYPEEVRNGAFHVSVCRDAVVPVVSDRNPVWDRLESKGIGREILTRIFIYRNVTTWGEVVDDTTIKDPISVYTRADACGAASTWADYLGGHTQDDLTRSADVAIMHDPDLARAVSLDPLAIGYNNLNFAYDMGTGSPLEGLKVLPMDLNGNGSIDDEEEIFSDRPSMLKAIAVGIYPSPPARALNLVSNGPFEGEAMRFVEWILGEGQNYVEGSGYIPLDGATLEAQRASLRVE